MSIAMRAAGFGNAVHEMVHPENPKGNINLLIGGLITIAVVVGLDFLMQWLGVPTSMAGHIAGVPFEVSILTAVMFIIFWVNAMVYIQKYWTAAAGPHYVIASVIVTVILVASIVIHEFSHGLAALAFGVPIDHAGISWWGAFVAPEGTLNDLSPWGEIIVSFAGPAANFILGGLFAIVVWQQPESLLENSVQYLAVANIQLGRFNLFPLLMLDGGHVVDGFLRFFIADAGSRVLVEMGLFVVFVFAYRRYRKTHKPLEEYFAFM